MAEVLVTGGTGLLGGRVVAALVRRGHPVRILSRRARDRGGAEGSDGARLVRGDLASGLGLREAVAGVEAIVHCASATGARTPWSLRQVDVEGTRRLVRAARETGADAHLAYPSIVGVDAVPLSYYHAKRAAEEEVVRSGLAWTIGRSTQFHALVLSILSFLHRGPLVWVPRGLCVQPVDVAEVAQRLARAVEAGPGGRIADFGGPEVLSLEALARRYLRAHARRRARVVALPAPGRFAHAVRAGRLLCPGCPTGSVSFSDFLGRGGER